MSEKIGVVGAGKIGLIISSLLVRAEHEVALVEVNKERADRIRRNGVKIVGHDQFEVRGDRYAEIIYDATELSDFKPETILISTKANALKPVTDSLGEIDDLSEIHFVSVQNGLDTEEYISERLKTKKAYRMVLNFVGDEIADGENTPVTTRMSWLKGANQLGALHSQHRDYGEVLAGLLSSSGLDTEYSDDFRKSAWEKVILNSALCPICALSYTTMGQAMEFEPSRELTKQVLIEGLEVAKADGYEFGENALKEFLGYLETGGSHEPSMLVDVKNDKRTEIDWINGKIVEYGEKYGIETPYNKVLAASVRTIDEYRRPCLPK